MPILAQIFGSPKGPKFGEIQISGSMSESHNYAASVSKSPIETGSDISDHRRTNNVTISIDGIITSWTNSVVEDLQSTGADTAGDVYQKLLELFKNTDVFKMVTGLDIYDDCVFTSLSVTRDKTTGGTDTIHIKAEVEQLRFAKADSAIVPAEVAKKPTADVGQKPPAAAPPAPAAAAKLESLGHEAVDKFKALFE